MTQKKVNEFCKSQFYSNSETRFCGFHLKPNVQTNNSDYVWEMATSVCKYGQG